MKGEIDIAVAGMTMTSEREEVVDFVAPYFDQVWSLPQFYSVDSLQSSISRHNI